MASLKEIKGRIASIQSTQKITSAMRMVASAKLHRTQGMTETFLRYMESLREIVDILDAPDNTLPEGKDPSSLTTDSNDNSFSLDEQQEKSILLIPISSNSGLCGAFNNNIAKATLKRIAELKAEGIRCDIMPVGKKIAHELKKEGLSFCSDYVALLEKIEKGDVYAHIGKLMQYATEQFANGKIMRMEFVYHHFKSMGTQVISVKSIVPKAGLEATANTQLHYKTSNGYLTEPSREELSATLHPQVLNAEVYGTLLDSLTSEHAARMMAMQTADDNANDLLKELTLLYNKTRQQAITNELIDIMGGKAATS